MRVPSIGWLFCVCVPLAAQTVWNVPNGAGLGPYIQQAQPGDILQLASSHPAFTLDKGLVLLGTPTGTAIGSPSVINVVIVSVPPGQRASLIGLDLVASFFLPTGFQPTELRLQTGQVTISDLSASYGDVSVLGGSCILQQMNLVGCRVHVAGGLCELSDVVVHGRDSIGTTPTSSSVAISQSGGILVGSRVTAVGGTAQYYGSSVSSSPGVSTTGGTAFFTDCSFTGGNYGHFGGVAGANALVGNGNVRIARTSLTPGTGATGTSSGYQQVDTMVGMSCSAIPTRGASFQVTATAGNSQGVLGIVGGFDATPNTLPPIVEPLFGVPSQLIGLAIALPSPGAQVVHTVSVPAVAALFGTQVWLQAIQLAGPQIRASTVVGGTIL